MIKVPRQTKILLISTYEIGHQPFGLASPAAWLRRDGFSVNAVDCAIQPFPEQLAREADLVAFYLPMHTATRLAAGMIPRVWSLNPQTHICCYGLYAPMNDDFLLQLGVQTIIGGEFETDLRKLAREIDNSKSSIKNIESPHSVTISFERQQFVLPDRSDLPELRKYAQLCCKNASPKITGYTETTRGCKHLCRHCPIVPVYGGRFRVIQPEIVLADIRQQVEMGAQHITFGDPDFFNGPTHAVKIVRVLHDEFPQLTYDVTIKIEHLLKHREHLTVLRDTNCAFVTSAVEAVDDQILQIFDKGHTRADFVATAKEFSEIGLALNPTFVTFNPWISLGGYFDLLKLLAELNLVTQVSPIQLAIRLLIPNGSRLLELPETQQILGEFNRELLTYEWAHPDPRMDELQRGVMQLVDRGSKRNLSRTEIFAHIWDAVNAIAGTDEPLPELAEIPGRAEIPYLNEPWYC